MIRKVRFPLKYKFVVMITALLLLTMGFYLSYALNIFKEDKAADVYSITLTNSVSVAERVKLLISEDQRLLDVFKADEEAGPLKTKLDIVAGNETHVFGIECLVKNAEMVSAKNIRHLEETNPEFAAADLSLDSKASELLKQLPLGESKLEMGVVKNFPPHYSLLKSINPNLKCALHISYEKLMPLMNETLNYGTYIVSGNGKLFLKLNNKTKEQDYTALIKDQTIQNVQQGVKRFQENGENIIRAFAKVPGTGLIAVTEIEEGKAFLASKELIEKSLFFGLLILSVAVITGILFTRRMTKNVQTLFDATTEMSVGNFDVNPVAVGNDEIGALTDSFVDMRDKIVKFMEEMKEKARIEGELQVAKLVQNSFFPKHAVVKSSFNFDGHYQPASECSGDWWGFFEQKDKTTIIACDATGHGVPAALITAAAHSCISTLKLESSQAYISPKKVLERLNKVISSMNSEILMTAFVLELDEANKEITYANASHMTPFLLKQIDGEYTKEGVNPLQENNGKRLGENFDSQYEESKMTVETGDKIVLFSDGITEMTVEGKAWGQRNFLKSLFKAAPMSEAKKFIESVISDFKTYANGNSPQDDVTLICVSLDNKKTVIESVDEFNEIKSKINSDSFVITKLTNEENITKLLNNSSINHLIGHNTIDLEREIRLVEKLEASPVFKLSDYINENFKSRTWQMFSNKKIAEVTEEVRQEFEGEFKAGINFDVLRLVSEELLSNAFYHSGGEGHPLTRGQEIILTPDKSVEYMMAVSDEYVVVSVKGPSSISSRDKIVQSIERGYKEKAPLSTEYGAGLGLYMIYENCSQFWVISGKPDNGQIICVFEKFNRYKKALERVTSFHFLAKEISE